MAQRGALLQGSVNSSLLTMAWPMALGMVFMILVNVIDAFWVGRLGTAELAAMTFTFPVVGLVINLALGLSIGTSTAVARAVGQGHEERAARLTTHALVMALVFVGATSAVGLLFQDAIFSALGASDEVLPLIRDYMTLWFIGVVFLVVPIVVAGALRATGDAKTSMRVMLVAAVVNAILDPLFIFGWGPVPAIGLTGAAVATLAARVAGALFIIGVVLRRPGTLSLHVPSVREFMDSARTISSVGVPAAITNALGPVATALLTGLVARQGAEALAAYGIGARVDALVMMAPFSLAGALSPFIGQNWGAHLVRRVSDGIRSSLRFALIWGVLGAAVLFVAAEPVARVFTDDPKVVDALLIYLRTVPVGYAFLAIAAVASSTFNAVDRAVRSTILSVLRSLVFAVPAAYIGAQIDGLRGIFLGLVVAAVAASLFGVRWLRTLLDPDADLAHELGPELGPDAVPFDVSELLELEAMSIHKVRSSLVGFFVGKREIGHLHDDRLDLPLPLEVGENLVRRGVLDHHAQHPDNGWYSHPLDRGQAAWLLQLGHLLYELRQRGEGDPITQAELDAFTHTDACKAALLDAIGRWEPQ